MSQLLSILKKAKRLQPQGFFFLSVYTLNVNQILICSRINTKSCGIVFRFLIYIISDKDKHETIVRIGACFAGVIHSDHIHIAQVIVFAGCLVAVIMV
jgi:hypothetical protein